MSPATPQPTMSHALARIRKIFGDEILVRAGGRSILTPRAQRLRTPLREVLHRAENLFDDGGFDRGTDTREVAIAMTQSTALELLATRPHVAYEQLLDKAPYRALENAGLEWTVHIRLHDPLPTPRFIAGTDRVGSHRRRVLESMTTTDLWTARFPVDAGPLGTDPVWNPWIEKGAFRSWLEEVIRRAAP